jgi:hypothetical protein
MTFNNISSLTLGNLLQISFTNQVRNQISTDFRDFEYIKKFRVNKTQARELRFMFQSSLGVAAVQSADPGTSNRSFPRGQQAGVSEYTAKFKELNATLELEQNLWERANSSPEKYAKPLGIEVDSKAAATKRRMAIDYNLDGTGVVATLNASAASKTTPDSNELIFTVSSDNGDRGHIGCIEYGDILRLRDNDGTASALNTNLATEPVYWQVTAVNRQASTFQAVGLDADFAEVATIDTLTTQPDADDVFYRLNATIPDLTSISDYGTASQSMAGIESLAAADGRVVHGITMSGANAGTRLSSGAGGNPLDVSYIQSLLSQVKVRVGEDRYKYKLMSMSPEAFDSLMGSGEPDRRFGINENERGGDGFYFRHRKDKLECYTSEFCHPKRIWFIPEGSGGDKVLEFHGSDFKPVKGDKMQEWHLKPASGGGYTNMMVSYLQAIGVIVCNHPSAIACLDNFTV